MERLVLRDVLPPPQPTEPELEHALGLGESRPWFVQGLLGCGTWIGALLVAIVCVIALDKQNGKVAALLLSPLCLGAAVAVSHLRHSILYTQLAFIASLGGQALLCFALAEVFHLRDLQWLLALAAVQGLLLVALDSPSHRFLCAAGLTVLGYVWLHETNRGMETLLLVPALGLPILAWLFESRLGASWLARVWRPTAFGFLVAGLVLLGWPERHAQDQQIPRMILAALLGGMALAMARRVQRAQVLTWSCPVSMAAWGAALVAGLLAFHAPGLTAALLALVLGQHRNEALLKGLGLAGLAYFLWQFYGGMEVPLLQKALWLGISGLGLLGGRMALGRSVTAAHRLDRGAMLVLAAAGLVLLVVGGLVARKERVLATGQHVLLELAPRDPRSLMQGDYMRLDYTAVRDLARQSGLAREGHLLFRLGTDQVATFVRLDDGGLLEPGLVRIRYRRRGHGLSLGAETFFFQEGQAAAYARARYADLVLSPDGSTLLAGLRDQDRNRL